MMMIRNDNEEVQKILIKLELRGKMFIVDRNVLIKVTSTYFYGMLSSGVWQPNSDGVYVIDRHNEGFERILDCLSTGKLDCDGLTEYEIECVLDNLDYFLVPFVRAWDYSKVIHMPNAKLHLQLSDGRLCGTKQKDSNIYIYDMDTNIVEITFKGHTRKVDSVIQLKDGRICSCSHDYTKKVFNIESGHCDLTIVGEDFEISNCLVQLMDGRLCSLESIKILKIWNLDNGTCELSFDTFDYVLCMVQLRSGSICTGGLNGHIKIFNIATGLCEMTLIKHKDFVRAIIIIDEVRICSCPKENSIRLWNTTTGECERTFKGQRGRIGRLVSMSDGKICSVYYAGKAKIWNLQTGVCELTVDTCAKALCKVLQLHDGRLLTANATDAYLIGA